MLRCLAGQTKLHMQLPHMHNYLQSLVDQNHELRSEVMRLQQENMELSRWGREVVIWVRLLGGGLGAEWLHQAHHFGARAGLWEATPNVTHSLVARLLKHACLLACRAVADGSVRARSDLARIQLALEVTAREQLAAARERIQKELYDRMDDKTRRLVRA